MFIITIGRGMVADDQSQLKIIDFGFSDRYRVRKWEPSRNENIGTALFMAPE